jgi:hypothetical protein
MLPKDRSQGDIIENVNISPNSNQCELSNIGITTFVRPGKVKSFNFDKHGLGYILGDFFTNSSGHLAVYSEVVA